MKVKCIVNPGWDLAKESIEVGNIRGTKFDVEIGEVCIVYAMLTFQKTIKYPLLSKAGGYLLRRSGE